MAKYISRRIIQALIILFGVSILVFSLVNFIPGNPYADMLSPDIPPDQVEAMLQKVGYYDPIPVKFFKWIGRALQGDLGYSIFYKEPVGSIIINRLGNTSLLAVSSIILSTIIGITVGIYTARHRRGVTDNIASVLAFAALSIPTFFFGMILIKIFGVNLNWLPISGMITVGKEQLTSFDKNWDIFRHMILPTIVLGLMNSATMLRYTRSSMTDIQSMDFIRTARAKGLKENKVIYKHALKNALIQIVTVLSLQIPALLSGALLTETVFLWPGLGRLNYEAVQHRDYPLIMGIVITLACFTLIANLIADISYALIDPRIIQNDDKR